MPAVQSLASLLSRTTLDDHEQILDAANSTLNRSGSDTEALHVKIVAFLNLDRFDDALRVFQIGGDKLKILANFEYAYTLYKTGELCRAEEIAEKHDGRRSMKHLLAQLAYRLEKFQRAARLYQELSDQTPEFENDKTDLRINLGAVNALLEWSEPKIAENNGVSVENDPDGYEMVYNAACRSIARGEFAEGEKFLEQANSLCSATEGLSDDDKITESLPIVVQQIYVKLRLGKAAEADRLSSKINISGITDPLIRQIAEINALACSDGSNPYLFYRTFHSMPALGKMNRPLSFQATLIQQNSYIIDLLCNKHAGVAKSTLSHIHSGMSPTLSFSSNYISVLNAAAHARNATGRPALKVIHTLLLNRPNDLGLILTLLTLHAQTNTLASFIPFISTWIYRLETSGTQADLAVRYAPGLVAAIVAIYKQENRKSALHAEFKKTALYWISQPLSTPLPTALLLDAGANLLEDVKNKADVDDAARIFETILKREVSNTAAIGGLVAARGMACNLDGSQGGHDPSYALLVSRLPSAFELVQDIDAAALEEAGVSCSEQHHQQSLTSKKRNRLTAAGDDLVFRHGDSTTISMNNKGSVKRRRLSRKKMPREFDESKPVDPERWMPMRDRSYYRPKKNKGKARNAAAGLMQGGISQGGTIDVKGKEMAKTDVSKAPVGGKKKKKGKGGKW